VAPTLVGEGIPVVTNDANLSEADRLFRATFDNAVIGVGLLALDGRILRANRAVCRMSGYTEAELQQRRDGDNVHPDDRHLHAAEFAELVCGARDSLVSERRYLRKSGEMFWARISLSLVRAADGTPSYLVGMLEDIDQQKQLWAELRESEERFRAMFEDAAIGIALTTLDGRMLQANPAVCRMSGYSADELRQRADSANTYPDDRGLGADQVAALLAGQRATCQIEKRYVRKDGSVFWTTVHLSVVRHPDGSPAHLVAMVEDIDDKKRLWAELKASQARFQAVFENAAVGIALLTLDRRPLAFNPVTQRIIGYNLDELAEIDHRDLALPDDRALDAEWFEDLIAGHRNAYVMERRYRRKDGTVFWARINYSLVRDLDGQPDYLIGIIEDIDDQKRAIERLAEQETHSRQLLEQRVAERTRELEQVNALLQHKAAEEAVVNERTRLARDLHDAVTQTLFSSTLIAEVLPDIWAANPAEGRRRLEELRQLTRGALAEMRSLLVELRPNALVEIPLHTLLRQLSDAVIGRARLQVDLHVSGERALPPDVKITLYRIAQEALNNVVKHARAANVVVSLCLAPTVRLTVADNGSGFSPGCASGDHLGLKIMRERVDAIGARLTLDSTPGEGTQVTVVWQGFETTADRDLRSREEQIT
jgi:PAS domain S-box-containing protein